jgi:hypothetical protein
VLALEGTVIDDLKLPLPSDLKDISKAAALVSGIVEDRVPDLLNHVRSTTWDEDGALHAYEFRKFPIGFPDVLLVERANPEKVVFEIEAKSWYVLSGDALTARFLTSGTVIGAGTLVVVVAWMLDGVVSGSPLFLRIHVDRAQRLAAVRDAKWEAIEPADSHRVVQPENAPGTSRSALRTQAVGEILRDGRWQADADNFGKLDRLYDDELRTFTSTVSGLSAAGKSLSEWRTFIRSGVPTIPEDETTTAARATASALRGAAELASRLADALDTPRSRRRSRTS